MSPTLPTYAEAINRLRLFANVFTSVRGAIRTIQAEHKRLGAEIGKLKAAQKKEPPCE